jgi:GT2 family glycosyltransferase
MAPDLSIVVLSWNTADLLQACLRSLQADTTTLTREIIVVDNASADGSADLVAARFPNVKLIRNAANLLYSEGNNIGARAATGRFLCLLNSDTEVSRGALDQLVQYLQQHPGCGLVGPKLVNPDGSVQAGCRRFPDLAEAFWAWGWLRRTRAGQRAAASARMADFDHLTSRDVQQPLGACMMLVRDEFMRLGGLDPVLSLFYNDVDLCLRLSRGGRRIHYLATAVVMHHQGASTKKRVEEFGF